MTEIANVNTITSLFLYGTLEPPKDVEARLRSSDSPQSIDVKVDIFSYMSGPGRYASLYQTDVVKSFFAGDLPSEIFRVNESGEREITFGELQD